jgi:hypothetical protein
VLAEDGPRQSLEFENATVAGSIRALFRRGLRDWLRRRISWLRWRLAAYCLTVLFREGA